MVEDWADLGFVCRKIVSYHKNGDPVKDVVEQTPYSEAELLVELARDYLKSRKKPK
jgi:hypothetical protein